MLQMETILICLYSLQNPSLNCIIIDYGFSSNFGHPSCIPNSTNITTCYVYTWLNGITYTTSGVYYATVTNSAGLCTPEILNLTINPSSTSSVSVTACDTYSWNGTTYLASGIYDTTFAGGNSNGCDSTATLNLTLNSSSLNSTSNSTIATACDTYAWSVDGNTYTTSGTYTDISANTSGCDHTETLILTINSST